MAYQQNPGRGPMQKTGRNIPKTMCSPATQKRSQINDIAANVASVHNSGGNVNAYTSPGWKQKVKSKNYIGKKTIGQTQGAAYDANEINNAALMNYGEGLMRSRDSISTKQVVKHLKDFGKFNSNEYLKSGEIYDNTNDSNDSSPAQQRRDAISGRKIPEGVTFEKTKKSTDDFGATVYSTDYSKGGPNGIDLGPDFKPTKEQTRRANKRKAISGTVQNKIYSGKTAGIKPVSSVTVPEKLTPTKITPTRGSKVFEPIHGQSGLEKIDRGIKKVPGFFNGRSTRSSGFKGCL